MTTTFVIVFLGEKVGFGAILAGAQRLLLVFFSMITPGSVRDQTEVSLHVR